MYWSSDNLCGCTGIKNRARHPITDFAHRKRYSYNGMRAIMKKSHEVDDSCRHYSMVFYSCADLQAYMGGYASKFFCSTLLKEKLFKEKVE